MFINTKTIKAIAVLSFAKNSIASSFHGNGNANEAQAKKFEEQCGCSIESLTGQTIDCTNLGGGLSIPNLGTESSNFSYDALDYSFNSAESTPGTLAYVAFDDSNIKYTVGVEMNADSSIADGECTTNWVLGIGCWACHPPTVYPTSSPSDSPSFENDDEDNDENNNESDDEDENDDGSCCCCEEKEVESSLLWKIKNALFVGN
eukprot:CAMPEP_0178969366 /NCGR_PEP_ID=MMETSP0789-20121207/18816_1 /TAXON_ID=3005 /ORGANISM="Rhizosolenia setigera, Strain CCMP 1694" /LENGTH=203 /DNA_ID=CAMNT_0020655491 /DNA_START=179 /DNA_END=790 /DNA_ORIENTATION=+